jgi:hypothetical protein
MIRRTRLPLGQRLSLVGCVGLGLVVCFVLFSAAPVAAASCSGVPAFAKCTAYPSGASVTFNNTLYTSIAPIPNNRDCAPYPYDPSSDNWWTNQGSCSGGGGGTPTPTSSGGGGTPTPTSAGGGGGGGGIANNARFAVINKNSGSCVDASAAGTANGTAVQQWSCNGTGAQVWQFTATDSGFYKVLTINNLSQGWDVSGGASATGNGVKIQLWANGGGTNQQFMPVSEGGGDYHFVARHSGRCVDTPGSSTANGVQLQQWDCNGTAAQSFLLSSSSAPTPTPTQPPTPTPTSSGGGGGGGGGSGLRFCPYIDVSPGSGSAIMQLASNGSGAKCYTLAFILGAGCQASWFGAFPLNTGEAQGILNDVNNLKNAGGNVIISFGGAAAPELANVCPNASSLAAQYQAVINMYHPMAIDFDIEDFNPTAIDIRNQALTMISGAPIHYTLGVLPSGLTSAQTGVLSNARSHNVNVSLVNIMAMDYGGAVGDMYGAAISAANATKGQLSSLGYGGAQIGITPMIGQNDSGGEVFTIGNAQSLRNNAAGAAMLAFWSMGRDNGGCAGSGTASATCSGVSQSTWQFSQILEGY